jgi:hypothetical protein
MGVVPDRHREAPSMFQCDERSPGLDRIVIFDPNTMAEAVEYFGCAMDVVDMEGRI